MKLILTKCAASYAFKHCIHQNWLIQKEFLNGNFCIFLEMEQSLRLILTEGKDITEETITNVFNKLKSQTTNFSPDLYILTAEKFFDLPKPLQKSSIDNAEIMVQMYDRLQEPVNQFQIRALICQSLINSYRASQFCGAEATELNVKSIDYLYRALKIIQSNTLYEPLSLRAVFLFYQISTCKIHLYAV